MVLIFFTPTIYKAYKSADRKTIATPCKFKSKPDLPLYKSTTPIDVKRIENITVPVTFSLKNNAIITATSTGYMNSIVQAIPASI